jgi:hypothetical protein
MTIDLSAILQNVARTLDGTGFLFGAGTSREAGYPPDLQEEAVKTVLAQAELLCAEWV